MKDKKENLIEQLQIRKKEVEIEYDHKIFRAKKKIEKLEQQKEITLKAFNDVMDRILRIDDFSEELEQEVPDN